MTSTVGTTPLLHSSIVYPYELICDTSTRSEPEVRGMAEPIPPSAQSSSYSRLSSYVSTDRNGWYRRGRSLRTIFGRLRRRECCMLGAPSIQPTVPLHELPPARLVIHQQTFAHNDVTGRGVFNRGRAY